MRCRLTSDKRVVALAHWRFCSKHIVLLKALQFEVPNLQLLATAPNGSSIVVPAFSLNLEDEELRFLNPLEAA